MFPYRVRRTTSALPPSHPEGVLLELDSGSGGRPLCCSGVRWGRLVLAHGCLLPPEAVSFTSGGRLTTLPAPAKWRPRVTCEDGVLKGRVLAAWQCPLVAASAAELAARGWTFLGPTYDLALFLVVQLGEGVDLTLGEVELGLKAMLEGNVVRPETGQSVLLEATPFGAGHFFLNTWSKGIVSTVTGQGNSLLLCDAHAAPGSEGGGLYTLQEGRKALVGIVVQTLFQVRGEAVSLCLAASLHTVISSALGLTPPKETNTELPLKADVASRGVALLKQGSSWASAIALDSEKGIFLTCSHVLQGAVNDSVLLQWRSGFEPVPAKILYKSPSSSAFDVAILKTASAGPNFAPKISRRLPKKGEMVEVVGYGLLSPPGPGRALHGPLLSRGFISQSRPQMLQTSCAVHSGNSGGAVMQGQNLVGLVVGHTEIATDVRVPKNWPKINFAVPLAVIRAPIEEFLKTGDVSHLSLLSNFDNEAKRLWQLNPVPKSKL